MWEGCMSLGKTTKIGKEGLLSSFFPLKIYKRMKYKFPNLPGYASLVSWFFELEYMSIRPSRYGGLTDQESLGSNKSLSIHNNLVMTLTFSTPGFNSALKEKASWDARVA